MKKTWLPRILVPLCVLLALGAPFLGMSVLDPAALWRPDHPDAAIFWRLRLPRALAAFWAGAGLSVSGLAFQTLLRNPLATPFTLGVSSGAALGASLYLWLGASLPLLAAAGTLGASLAGGLAAMALVWGLTRAAGRGGNLSIAVILLAGVICNFFFSSLVLFIQYLSDARDSLRILHWLMGSLAGAGAGGVAELALVVLAGTACISRLSPELDLLTGGEELAVSRGVDAGRVRGLVFVAASVMVGAVVALAGPIGFVGMMLPHMCRLWLGWSHARLLPWVFGLGGCFLVVCDLFSRWILAPAELPVGIVTALLGGPFFLWVLLGRGARADEQSW